MAVEATLRWSDDDHVFADGRWSAVRGWDVVGAQNHVEAINAPGIPAIGTPHPNTPRMLLSAKRARREGVNYQIVTGVYNQLGPGDEEPNEEEDPLLQPTKLTWDLGTTNEPIDRDFQGNPIVNSARDAFTTPPTEDVHSIFLEARRNEPFFNVRRAIDIQNATNSAAFNLAGVGVVAKGQAKLVIYKPEAAITAFDTFAPVVYIFEFRQDGFKIRVRDQGTRAWGYKPGAVGGTAIAPVKVHVHDANKQPISNDVALSGRGIPLDNTLKLIHKGGVGHATVETELTPRSLGSLPPGAEEERTGDAVFLKYTTKGEFNFSSLNL